MDVMVRSQAPGKSLPADLLMRNRGDGFERLARNAEVVQQRGMHGLGMTAQEIADLIKQSSAATLPLIVAQNPGVYYTQDPRTGAISVYSQPVGSTQNLPVGGAGFPVATVNTPLGSASTSGIDMGTVATIGLVGIGLFMLAKR